MTSKLIENIFPYQKVMDIFSHEATMATPSVLPQPSQITNKASPQWIQVNISNQFKKIRVPIT
jgi:hypothetical protein